MIYMVSSTLCLSWIFDFPYFGAKSTVRFVYEAPKMKKTLVLHQHMVRFGRNFACVLTIACSIISKLSKIDLLMNTVLFSKKTSNSRDCSYTETPLKLTELWSL